MSAMRSSIISRTKLKFIIILLIFLAIATYKLHWQDKSAEHQKGQSEKGKQDGAIVIMTMNTWQSGNNVNEGLKKMTQHISAVNPHIVALQEAADIDAKKLCSALNRLQPSTPNDTQKWRNCKKRDSQIIVTRLPIVRNYNTVRELRNAGCEVRIRDYPTGVSIRIWNAHLEYRNYGPYAACKTASQNAQQAASEEEKKRLQQIRSLLKHSSIYKPHSREPHSVLLMGDFNAPSHLDWTEEATFLHCNVSVEWPVSAHLAKAGFTDTFREMHPDPVDVPGETWSPVFRHDTPWSTDLSFEPQDRIDFIYLKSKVFKVIASYTYTGDEKLEAHPNHRNNPWPSDHSAVVTKLVLVDSSNGPT